MYMEEEYNSFYKIRDLNFFIIFLVLILFLIMLIVDFSFKIRLNFLYLVLIFIIIIRDLLIFFYLYEIVFILIMFVIVLLGYRLERLIAAYIIIFYSFLFSRPTLIILLVFDFRFLMKQWLFYRVIINYFLIGSFMVKFPIFGFIIGFLLLMLKLLQLVQWF